jgi:hypothetical protein
MILDNEVVRRFSTDIVKRVERGEFKPHPARIAELRLN